MRTATELRAEEMNMVNGGLIEVYDTCLKVVHDESRKGVKKFKFNDDNFDEQYRKAIACAQKKGVSIDPEFHTTKNAWDFLVEKYAK